MGTFRIEIQAVGGHGCQREIKNGGKVADCGQPNCPDCIARRCVKALKDAGVSFGESQMTIGGQPGQIGYARLTHWPYGYDTVYDDLLTGDRTNSF